MLEFSIKSEQPVATMRLLMDKVTKRKTMLSAPSSEIVTDHSSYYRETMGNPAQLKRIVDRSCRQIRKAMKDGHLPKIDAIACRGISGIIVASAVSVRLGVQLIVVRKTLDECHAESLIEGQPHGSYNFICLDDFVCSGDTISKTCEALTGEHVGNYFYRGDMYSNGVRIPKVKGAVGGEPTAATRKYRKST